MTERTTPYKIAIFGPGDAGCIVIREATRLPEFQVVGALVFSEKKGGIDIGTLAGTEKPIGVKTTGDFDEFLKIDCDVVVHTALDAPFLNPLADFVRLLEAGKNVVTSHPYSYLPARDPAFGEAIKSACKKGKATFYATGLNPDLMTQRVVPLLTGLSNDITRIQLEEYFNCQDQSNASNLQVIGIGGAISETIDDNSPAIWYQKHYNYQMIYHVCREFGVKIDRIEAVKECIPAPEDVVRPVLTVKKGQTALISYTSTGYVDNEPFISIKITYFFGQAMKPVHLDQDNVYIITIEGRPSSRTVLSLRPSYLTDTQSIKGEPAAPAYVTFAVALLQAVPMVAEAPQGFKSPDVPPVHWKKDQRNHVASCYQEI
ncbi:uncharacterized protein A1O5_00775 [Cladophialophora psammophila CBS 110553]|uniref:Uncharacterized protein n=1 Tax=Cladophialophora psammophila CBS 110553 TaxID=1182543 RepID=W9X716_9EURO|nr:uncharacterized protein A1O5_00775 [Cladophialophora psammophila CBS 110553]EXJ76267.1 hypothetical protein A1O5_00775 [Cladophialophora psammophila CBS 110553]